MMNLCLNHTGSLIGCTRYPDTTQLNSRSVLEIKAFRQDLRISSQVSNFVPFLFFIRSCGAA
jgi:hypothetical protein